MSQDPRSAVTTLRLTNRSAILLAAWVMWSCASNEATPPVSSGTGETTGPALSSGGSSGVSSGSATSSGGNSDALGGSGGVSGGSTESADGDNGAGDGSGSVGAGATGGTAGIGEGGGAVLAPEAGSADGSPMSSMNGCTPQVGSPYSYACWPMPNPASAGLPNPASYTDLGDGTVKDNITGLVWQKTVTSQQAYNWSDAQSYCANLMLAGRVWHLPTRIELLSIVDFTRTSSAIDPKAFPNTPGGKYHWTSSPWVVSQLASKPQYAWIVNFYEGLTSNAGDRAQLEYARCVSSSVKGPLPKLYLSVAAGEVVDTQTKLIWQQADSGSPMAFAAAMPYCQSLALNGHMWRVPSIKELSTLVDESPPIAQVSPAIDTVTFPGTPASASYWSSSLFNNQPATSHAPWVVGFADGFTQYNQTMGMVRCVR